LDVDVVVAVDIRVPVWVNMVKQRIGEERIGR
jgi:hypothetical protein